MCLVFFGERRGLLDVFANILRGKLFDRYGIGHGVVECLDLCGADDVCRSALACLRASRSRLRAARAFSRSPLCSAMTVMRMASSAASSASMATPTMATASAASSCAMRVIFDRSALPVAKELSIAISALSSCFRRSSMSTSSTPPPICCRVYDMGLATYHNPTSWQVGDCHPTCRKGESCAVHGWATRLGHRVHSLDLSVVLCVLMSILAYTIGVCQQQYSRKDSQCLVQQYL